MFRHISRPLRWIASILFLVSGSVQAQCVSLTTLGSPYTQNFDSLAITGTSATLPSGWFILESGTNANMTYTAGTGSSTAGETYSFGAAGSTERALGGVQSGSLIPSFGACFTNNTGATLSSLDIAYVGEQWRTGTTGRQDRIDFGYSTDATSLNTGNWNAVTGLSFSSPSNIAVGALDGNAAANRIPLSSTISGLNIANGTTFWIRWTDFNASGADDGLAVDDFSLTPGGPSALPLLSIANVAQAEGNAGVTSFVFTVSLSVPAPMGGVTFDIATADGTAIAGSDYVAKSLNAQTIAQGQSAYQFSVDVIGDTTPEPNETFTINVTGIMGASNTSASATGTIIGEEPYRIHDIQGSGTASPFAGQTVPVEGIVTFVSQGSNSLGGFFIQEPDARADADPATSEGVFVFTNAAPATVSIGDFVRVTGTVTEFGTAPNTLTEIVTPTVTLLSTGNNLPAFVTVSLPVAAAGDLERYEGMRVRFSQTLTVSDHFDLMRFGEITVTANGRAIQPTNFIDPNDNPASGTTSSGTSNVTAITTENDRIARSRLIIDGAFSTFSSTVPFLDPMTNTLRLGSTVSDVTGVISQIGGTHRMYPDVAPVFTYAPRPATPPAVGGNIKVASMNVLNYFNGDGAGGGFPTSRGADSQIEFNRQRAKVLSAILGLNADVVGLLEVENDGNGATSAIQDIVNGLNAASGAGTWAFVPDPVGYGATPGGTDAIRPAIIYKTAKVNPDGASQTSADAAFSNARSPVAQAFTVPTNGEKFTLVVNHFKSKSSSGASGADVDQGDGQAAFNNARKLQAQALAGFINTLAMTTPRVIAMGDFNAYAQEDPLDILRAAGLKELVSSDSAYMFGGLSGALDHAFGTTALQTAMTGSGHWHINADEPTLLDYNVENKNTTGCSTACTSPDLYTATPFRSSDHDPVLVGLQLGANACLAGSYSMSGNEPCTAASPGNFVSTSGATAQVACALGTYQPISGATACNPATAGNFVGVTGAIAQSPCAIGTYSSSGGASQCTLASPGSFVGGSGASAQTPCMAGTFSSTMGASMCDPATPGNFVPMTGAAMQTPCPVGTFSNLSGAIACTPASAGNFVSTVGSSNETACVPGTYQPNAGQMSCLQADAGSFVDASGATMQQFCLPGSFSASSGAASCTPASPGNAVGSPGATGQTPCAIGTYQLNAGATFCTPASPGNYIGSIGSSVQFACLPGTYQPNAGASACIPASPGNAAPGSGATMQSACVPGTFQPNSGEASCYPASPGAYVSVSGSSIQTACPAGTYQPNSGATACLPADAGSFVANGGANAQTPCAIGTYSSVPGAISCTPASAGSFVAVPGASGQIPCPPGSYQPASGATTCIPASPGFFVAGAGASTQTTCPMGATSIITGATMCIPLFTVTPSAGMNGSIAPSAPVPVAQGQTTVFTVMPIAGYTASVTSSCGGSLSGTTFTTAAITADCNVQASFALTVVVPDRPQISVATPGNMQVALTVIPPMFDGGAPITSYVFTCGSISVTSSTIRATVTGLTNFVPAVCTVVAVNVAGPSLPSLPFTVVPLPPLELLSAVSRKTHGAAGDFDLPIALGVPINGPVTVEPRANMGTHQLILTVNIPISTGIDAELTDDQNNNIALSVSATGQGSTIIVNLSGVQNRKRARLTLRNINGSETAVLTMGFLIGDVNGNGAVNNIDVSAIKARAGASIANDNFLYDINLTGKITGADVAAVKARSGTSLP